MDALIAIMIGTVIGYTMKQKKSSNTKVSYKKQEAFNRKIAMEKGIQDRNREARKIKNAQLMKMPLAERKQILMDEMFKNWN